MNIVIYFLIRNVKLFFVKPFRLKRPCEISKLFLRQTISNIQYVSLDNPNCWESFSNVGKGVKKIQWEN